MPENLTPEMLLRKLMDACRQYGVDSHATTIAFNEFVVHLAADRKWLEALRQELDLASEAVARTATQSGRARLEADALRRLNDVYFAGLRAIVVGYTFAEPTADRCTAVVTEAQKTLERGEKHQQNLSELAALAAGEEKPNAS